MKKQFPEKLLDSIVANFIFKQTTQNATSDDTLQTVPKKELLLVLPYLGHESSRKLNLTSLVSLKVYPQVDITYC